MRAGRLRKRITIEQRIPGSDFAREDSWTDFVTVWAAVEPVRGAEAVAAEQIQSEVSAKVVMRYLGGLRPDMRIRHEGRIYEIIAIIDVEERHRELNLMVKETAR